METSPRGLKKLSFEERLARLEEIVEELEEGQMGLEKSLKLFEEAVEIGKSCRAELTEAELRISTLTGEVEHEDDSEHSGADDGQE